MTRICHKLALIECIGCVVVSDCTFNVMLSVKFVKQLDPGKARHADNSCTPRKQQAG